ncbi:MAG: hypothetical protein A2X45_06455 [Lentisphaerae bacterium GWF2_50_93]|nr:MAG: hypothetical protein A2X45_06455 [Lentisphaerae bacterium GWF2_50_93]
MRIRNSYTLIEMVIAVGIFGMVMLLASMGLVVIQKTWNSIANQNQKMRNCQLIDAVVDSAFRNAIPFLWTNAKTKKNSVVFSGEPGRVALAYQHRINNVDEGGIRFIALFLENEKLVAEYKKTPILPWDGKGGGRDSFKDVLAENVRAISFTYADMQKQNIVWTNSWDKNYNSIPVAIQIKVEWMNGDSEVWMRRTAGAGLRETYGARVDNFK